jgi:ferric-dicitrate binding protein FerR (iron transport regulator)
VTTQGSTSGTRVATERERSGSGTRPTTRAVTVRIRPPRPEPRHDATRHLIGVTAGLLAVHGPSWTSRDREVVSEAIRAARAERSGIALLDDSANGPR